MWDNRAPDDYDPPLWAMLAAALLSMGMLLVLALVIELVR
jgi:hypothetical protein